MSHEIRTPMTAILGFADELEAELASRAPEDPARVSLRTIQRNGEHLLALINGILDLSKIEAGKFSIERSRVSVLEVVSHVLQLLGARAREKGLTLEAECDGPVPVEIKSDAVRLRQILINLVGNAIKFTSAGYVRLRLRIAAPDPSAGHLLEIAVEDSGIGLDLRQQAIVFEPFTQVQSSAAREFGGTGLGLSLSRRLARLLGGDIEVASAPGRGSTFTLRVATGPLEHVPMLTGGAISALEPLVPTPPRREEGGLLGRVLVAEDGADNQRLLRAILGRAGLEVELVDNGELAVERALAADELGAPYDVVLMDMQMPVLDGYAATQRLRAQGYTGPVIALTAHAMAGDREKCLLAGCDDYATKPIARERLIEQISRQLAKKR
jgi:CheY-like chemotaxis protein